MKKGGKGRGGNPGVMPAGVSVKGRSPGEMPGKGKRKGKRGKTRY